MVLRLVNTVCSFHNTDATPVTTRRLTPDNSPIPCVKKDKPDDDVDHSQNDEVRHNARQLSRQDIDADGASHQADD